MKFEKRTFKDEKKPDEEDCDPLQCYNIGEIRQIHTNTNTNTNTHTQRSKVET